MPPNPRSDENDDPVVDAATGPVLPDPPSNGSHVVCYSDGPVECPFQERLQRHIGPIEIWGGAYDPVLRVDLTRHAHTRRNGLPRRFREALVDARHDVVNHVVGSSLGGRRVAMGHTYRADGVNKGRLDLRTTEVNSERVRRLHRVIATALRGCGLRISCVSTGRSVSLRPPTKQAL